RPRGDHRQPGRRRLIPPADPFPRRSARAHRPAVRPATAATRPRRRPGRRPAGGRQPPRERERDAHGAPRRPPSRAAHHARPPASRAQRRRRCGLRVLGVSSALLFCFLVALPASYLVVRSSTSAPVGPGAATSATVTAGPASSGTTEPEDTTSSEATEARCWS